jgi:hypothetical protein
MKDPAEWEDSNPMIGPYLRCLQHQGIVRCHPFSSEQRRKKAMMLWHILAFFCGFSRGLHRALFPGKETQGISNGSASAFFVSNGSATLKPSCIILDVVTIGRKQISDANSKFFCDVTRKTIV